MAATYHVQIISPQQVVVDTEIESLVAPGSLGYLGVLANHAPLITSLTGGTVKIRDAEGKESTCRISGGFLEVANNQAVILADGIESD